MHKNIKTPKESSINQAFLAILLALAVIFFSISCGGQIIGSQEEDDSPATTSDVVVENQEFDLTGFAIFKVNLADFTSREKAIGQFSDVKNVSVDIRAGSTTFLRDHALTLVSGTTYQGNAGGLPVDIEIEVHVFAKNNSGVVIFTGVMKTTV